MADIRIGSMFTGMAGLDLGVEEVFPGAELAWFADLDPGASAILACHFPGVPNLGDVTAVDWKSGGYDVDILTAGFPCQDVSSAGRRAGLRKGTRTGLWLEVARAVDELRPPLVVIENVLGLLSGKAHSDLEWCEGCMGDRADDAILLRALGAVLGDLSSLRYDAEWETVPASAAGAPHRRERIFILARRQKP